LTALPKKALQCTPQEKEEDQRTPGEQIWRKLVSNTAGRTWRQQHRTDLDGEKWFLAYVRCTGNYNIFIVEDYRTQN